MKLTIVKRGFASSLKRFVSEIKTRFSFLKGNKNILFKIERNSTTRTFPSNIDKFNYSCIQFMIYVI